MDGISNLAGNKQTTLEIGGKVYTLSPMVLRNYAEREAYILSLKPDPMEIINKLSEQVSQEVFERAWKEATRPRIVTMDEEDVFDRSLHGVAWRFWRSVRGNHPEVETLQDALDLIEQAGNESFGRILDAIERAEERDLVKN